MTPETSHSAPQPPTFIREIEPMPKKGRARMAKHCGYCKSEEHTRTVDCPKYQAYKRRRGAGRRATGQRRKIGPARGVTARSSVGGGASAAIRAEIERYEGKIATLKSALVVLEG